MLYYYLQLKKSQAEEAGSTQTILKLTNKLREESNALKQAQTELAKIGANVVPAPTARDRDEVG